VEPGFEMKPAQIPLDVERNKYAYYKYLMAPRSGAPVAAGLGGADHRGVW
jgi:hypothetical protein